MAGLQRAQRRTDDFEEETLDYDPAPAETFANDDTPPTMVRPRIGARARSTTKSKRGDGATLMRVLAVSAAVLIVGTGGLVALHLIAPGDGSHVTLADAPLADASLAAVSLAAVPLGAVSLGDRGDAKPATAPAAPQVATHARMAAKVASILGGSSPASSPAPSAAAPVNAMVATIAPADAAQPSAADFARPAFIEPIDANEADLPEAATATSASGSDLDAPGSSNLVPAPVSAPLPAPRPKVIAAADADTRSARIRIDVTLRSGPRRSASAIGTLDEGTRVTLASPCKSWCEVSAGDKRGFVYRNAVAQ